MSGHSYAPAALLPVPIDGGWVGPRAGLDAVGKSEISCHCPYSDSDSSTVQAVARCYTDSYYSCTHNCGRDCISEANQEDRVTVQAPLCSSPARRTRPLKYVRSQIPHEDGSEFPRQRAVKSFVIGPT
jgi:hypothetical protein